MNRARHALVAGVWLVGVAACGGGDGGGTSHTAVLERALGLVTGEGLRSHVEVLASDDMEGRRPGSAGHDRARDYIARALGDRNIERGGEGGSSYLHVYPTQPRPEYLFPYPNGANVVGIHRGTVAPDEMVVVTAHYDHLGHSRLGLIYNGAYDNAAAVAALIELADAFRRSGYQPARSVVFLFTDEEETPGDGVFPWLEAPTMGRTEDIVFGIAVDPIGRPNFPGYMWTAIFGLEHSPALEGLVRDDLDRLSREDVIAGNRSLIPFFGSDHDLFYQLGIPAAWFMTPGFSFYHQPSDDPETVDYGVLLEATAVLARLIDLVANDTRRYPYVAETPITPANLLPFRTVFQRFAGAGDVLSDLEIGVARNVVAQLDEIERRGAIDPTTIDSLSIEATAAIFLTSVLHRGPVPVPFPDGATAATP